MPPDHYSIPTQRWMVAANAGTRSDFFLKEPIATVGFLRD
jgi:hypothetical protein